MIFDTDILVWLQRGNQKAGEFFNSRSERYLSVQTYLELFQDAENKEQQAKVKRLLIDHSLGVLPIDENISHRAMTYILEYGLSHGLQAGDALIAATAVEHNMTLATGNAKHFRAIKGLQVKVFKP
jgi:predicted nucleic acid-binding protein